MRNDTMLDQRKDTDQKLEFSVQPHREAVALYDRFKNESDPAWEAFVAYRDLGTSRSLAVTAKALGKSVALMERWSRTNSWVTRVRAYDAECDRHKTAGEFAAIEEMRNRQIALACDMQNLVAAELEKIMRFSTEQPDKAVLKPIDILRLCEHSSRLERLCRGEPGSIEEKIESAPQEIDYSILSTDELVTLQKIKQRLGASSG
jgi:hypothetical protein